MIDENLLKKAENRAIIIEQDAVTVSLDTAKRLADHYLALAQYWRKVAKLPPVMTATALRKQAGTPACT